ncbi:uncharacterized protein LOC109839394 [Asparagus officinalis]|uniref:uncharacterized protein LOC109839394 n=1 Tax=Asparagus officinalis TaxID=4686 RepID=UPI00098E61B1|nr:uncharacterized protein LOC109839394 [Asparagus officinalis]
MKLWCHSKGHLPLIRLVLCDVHKADMGLVKPMEELVPSSSSSAVINSNISIGNSTSMIRPQLQPHQLMAAMEAGAGGQRASSSGRQKEQASTCPRVQTPPTTKFWYYTTTALTQPRVLLPRPAPILRPKVLPLRNSPSAAAAARTSASSPASSPPRALPPSLHCFLFLRQEVVSEQQNPNPNHNHDLNLAFPILPEFPPCTNAGTSAMELLRGRGLNPTPNPSPFMPMHPMPIPEYPSGFGVQDFRSSALSFGMDGAKRRRGWSRVLEWDDGRRSVDVSPPQPRFLPDMKAQRAEEESNRELIDARGISTIVASQ